jgi:hypothetical protein
MEVSGQLHNPSALPQGIAPCTHWIGGWDTSKYNYERSEPTSREKFKARNLETKKRALIPIVQEAAWAAEPVWKVMY